MASIKDTADRQVTAGRWKSIDDGRGRVVYHYRTPMLAFVTDEDGQWDGDLETVDYSIGHGSVSDQNGMNVLFARLGMPYIYRRARGARIETLDGPQFRYPVSDKSKHGWKQAAVLP